jgi:hypothetical protein
MAPEKRKVDSSILSLTTPWIVRVSHPSCENAGSEEVKRIPAWSSNLTTRAISTPKLIVTDSGLGGG